MENTVTSTGGGVVPGAGTARARGVRARAVGRVALRARIAGK